MNKEMNIGLISSRHPLPVEKYILSDSVDVFTKAELKPLIVNGLKISI